MRASILTVNGVIPSARRHTPVILLGDDRTCGRRLEPDCTLLEKTAGCIDGDSDLLGVWNVGFGGAEDVGVPAGYEFKPNSNGFRSGEWLKELGCCTDWKSNGYANELGVNGEDEKPRSLTTGDDERVRRGSVGKGIRVPPGEYESDGDIGLKGCPGEGGNSDWNSDGEKFGDVEVDEGVSISS